MSPLNTGLYLLSRSEQVHKIQQSFTPSHTVNRLQSLERPTLAEKNSYSHEAFRHVFLLPSFIIYWHIGNIWHFIYEPKKCLFITSFLVPQKLDRANGILKPLGWFNGIVQANLLNKSNTNHIYLNPLFRFESLSMKTRSALHISSTPLEMTPLRLDFLVISFSQFFAVL